MADLRVHVSAHAGGWRCQWHHDGVATGSPVDVPAHTANQLGSLGSTIAQAFDHRSPDGFARLPLMASAALAHTGVQLRDLCCGPVAAHLAGDTGAHRLTVVGNLPAALNLPWELLPVGGRGEPLGCHKHWGLFRTPADAPLPPGVRRGGPLRILFLAAAPTDQHVLDYEKEEEAILRATATLQGALLFTAELGSYEALEDLLVRVKPHIVHLSGHGAVGIDGVGRFCFEDDAGHTDARTAADLARLFGKRDVPCVFLNGCQTSQAAVAGICQELTSAGLSLALGWAASVADERATAFAETFYRELLAGEPVPAAAALARLRIQREGIRRRTTGREEEQELTFLLPQLYAARPVEVLFDPESPRESFQGVETRYELLPRVPGLKSGFVGRRREQQLLLPKLRDGDITFLLLHGTAGQGKSTLATRLVNRLEGVGFEARTVSSTRQQGETAAMCAISTGEAVVGEIAWAARLAGQMQWGEMLDNKGESLEKRLTSAARLLSKLKCVLVLDNFEDVLEVGADGVWRIANAGLNDFYALVQTQLTKVAGGRVVVTSRFLPAATQPDQAGVWVVRGLNDFKDYEFLKLLKRDPRVAQRIGNGELPIPLLKRLYAFAGGTPRFLERLRTLLRKFPADELEAALAAGSGTLVEARDKYLEDHFGPKLFGLLSGTAQALVSRLGLSQFPLPEETLAALMGLDETGLAAAVRQGVEFGLLQVFEASDLPTLYLPPGVWRGWLEERLSDDERLVAHDVLAAFWREVFEKDLVLELRLTVIDGLQACRTHAKYAGNRELWLWSSVWLSSLLEGIAEWHAARAVLAEIPEGERDGAAWHHLATIDLNEGDYPAARVKLGKALVMRQKIGDHQGEADTWHQLARTDLEEGNYSLAREQFIKSLAIRQQISDRQGEAVTGHELARIDLQEGNYQSAREKFSKSLEVLQQIGDSRGQASTWYGLASIDLEEGNHPAARERFSKSLAIEQQIGDRQGETSTQHQLATIYLNEGNFPAAREKFGKVLEMHQQIGDRHGEAAAYFQLGSVAFAEENLLSAAKLVGVCFLIDEVIGHGDTQQDWQSFCDICARLELTQIEVDTLLAEIGASYEKDQGWSLLKEAFPDWQ